MTVNINTLEKNINALKDEDVSISYQFDNTNEEVKNILEKIAPELLESKGTTIRIDDGNKWDDEKYLFLGGNNNLTRRYVIKNGVVTLDEYGYGFCQEDKENENLNENLNTLLKHSGTVSTARKPGEDERYIQDIKYKLKEGQTTYGNKKCEYEDGKLVGKTGLDEKIDSINL